MNSNTLVAAICSTLWNFCCPSHAATLEITLQGSTAPVGLVAVNKTTYEVLTLTREQAERDVSLDLDPGEYVLTANPYSMMLIFGPIYFARTEVKVMPGENRCVLKLPAKNCPIRVVDGVEKIPRIQ